MNRTKRRREASIGLKLSLGLYSVLGTTAAPGPSNFALREDGSYALREDDSKVLRE